MCSFRQGVRVAYLAYVSIFLLLIAAGSRLVRTFYRVACALGLSGLMDWAFGHVEWIRAWFAFRLGSRADDAGAAAAGAALPTARDLIVARGFRVEEHSVITKDGYVLGLQRILPLRPHERRPRRPVDEVLGAQAAAAASSNSSTSPSATTTATAASRPGVPHSPTLSGTAASIAQLADLTGVGGTVGWLRADADVSRSLPNLATPTPMTPPRPAAQPLEHPDDEHLDDLDGELGLGMEDDSFAPSSLRSRRPKPAARRGRASSSTSSSSYAPAYPDSPPILIMHGLMQCSEAWLCPSREESLAYQLADAGYDVWLGNNRGNKYSCKHVTLSPEDEAFWNFSIDEMARFDVPALVHYILRRTGHAKLGYVGFSQGTAQAFAALSSHPDLAQRVACFVALSAAVAVRGLKRSVLSSLVEADLNFIYLLFGRLRMLPIALASQEILSRASWAWLIDRSIHFLFGWTMENISAARKEALYPHIYSFASVKTTVHWFQILRDNRFQMFIDGNPSPHQVPALYDVSTIRVPLAIFVGGADTIIDIKTTLQRVPPHTYVFHEPTYEHLDFMWADSAAQRSFPALIRFVQKHIPAGDGGVAAKDSEVGTTLAPAVTLSGYFIQEDCGTCSFPTDRVKGRWSNAASSWAWVAKADLLHPYPCTGDGVPVTPSHLRASLEGTAASSSAAPALSDDHPACQEICLKPGKYTPVHASTVRGDDGDDGCTLHHFLAWLDPGQTFQVDGQCANTQAPCCWCKGFAYGDVNQPASIECDELVPSNTYA